MLIIFDLDDTLIDTSGCLTPLKLEDALREMVAAGLRVPDEKEALDLLKRIDQVSLSGSESLAEFLEILGADPSLLEIGKKELYGSLPADATLFPLEGATELLTQLAQDHQLALVTAGKPVLQMEKLKKAGIDTGFFSKILVSEGNNKKFSYQGVVEELGYSSNEVLVCGDRIKVDLTPAKDLGFKTVHMRWGRGLNSQSRKSEVDFQIKTLKELKDIVTQLITFSSF